MSEPGEGYRPPEVRQEQSPTEASRNWLQRRVAITAAAGAGTYIASINMLPEGAQVGGGVAAAMLLAWQLSRRSQ